MDTRRVTEAVYGVLRLVLGLLFACHGAQKLLGWFGGTVMTGQPKMLIAGIIELGGGLLIAAGLMTRIAAFLSAGEMAAAYFTVHAPQGLWPIENKGELAVVYCFAFLFVTACGPGLYSLDSAIRRAQRRAVAVSLPDRPPVHP